MLQGCTPVVVMRKIRPKQCDLQLPLASGPFLLVLPICQDLMAIDVHGNVPRQMPIWWIHPFSGVCSVFLRSAGFKQALVTSLPLKLAQSKAIVYVKIVRSSAFPA